MPDENKFKILVDAGFVVRRTCLRCVHFQNPLGSRWGTCDLMPYDHMKHTVTGVPRFASVPIDGSCPGHEFRPGYESDLMSHALFIEAKERPRGA